ncbi:MAG: protocatechuate 3,4-dioxygenase subunit alpha [Verrucomicrobiota bacterium]
MSSRPRTPSQTVGPYYAIGLTRAPRAPQNELADRSDPGSLRLIGQLLDGQGSPIGDGMVEVWDGVGGRWGRSGTDSEGRFSFVVTKPVPRPGEAPRFDVLVFARGMLRHELTRIYFPDEAEANAADPVYAALEDESRATLVAEAEDGALRFDIRMQGDRHTVFFEH